MADALVFGLMKMDPATDTTRAVHFFVEYVTNIIALLTVIVFLIGFFRSLVSRQNGRGI